MSGPAPMGPLKGDTNGAGHPVIAAFPTPW
jgi:hypothetical protein